MKHGWVFGIGFLALLAAYLLWSAGLAIYGLGKGWGACIMDPVVGFMIDALCIELETTK